MKKVILLLFLFTGGTLVSQTSLAGRVIERDNRMGVPLANVALYKGTNLIIETQVGEDGFYTFSSIDPGTYRVEASYLGFLTDYVEGVVIYMGKTNKLDLVIELSDSFECSISRIYTIPLINPDETTSGATFSAGQLRKFYHGSLFTEF